MDFWHLSLKKSSLQQFTQECYIKESLTEKISCLTLKLIYFCKKASSSDNNKVCLGSEIEYINDLLNLIEAAFLHGLKEKLKFNRVLNKSVRVLNLDYRHDFWSVLLILSHNQVFDSINRLKNITTDIGRCRAWLRIAFNDGLFFSYLEALINDKSLLYGFYKPYSYLRDKKNVTCFKKLMKALEPIEFKLDYDQLFLNNWSNSTLKLITPQNNLLTPVVAAVDALSTINSDSNHKKANTLKKNVENQLSSSFEPVVGSSSSKVKSDTENFQSETNSLSTSVPLDSETQQEFKSSNDSLLKEILISEENFSFDNMSLEDFHNENETKVKFALVAECDDLVGTSFSSIYSDSFSIGGNSIKKKDGWSTSPPKEEPYESLLLNYSSAAVLSSTPDPQDSTIKKKEENEKGKKKLSIFDKVKSVASSSEKSISSHQDFEIIPKSMVMSSSESFTQDFFHQLTTIANHVGLDNQDYKCYWCARPIGLIYGTFRVCNFDGFNYCTECHNDEKAVIPARVLNNWDFTKHPVSNQNLKKLQMCETEPRLDIKVASPILYQVIKEMQEMLDLRTQLFFLYAYLFTCKETTSSQLRQLLWPKEHLFEQIHLYSLDDLIQIQSNGSFITNIRKAIQFGRKHVLSCLLCSQKGFICEICRSSQIIYPFDTNITYRCDKCKAVFHNYCYFNDKMPKSCPRCLRIRRRERSAISI